MKTNLNDIVNDIAHITVGLVIASGSAVTFTMIEKNLYQAIMLFLLGVLVGLLAEAKEDNPNVFKSRLSTFNPRDIVGYGIGFALVSLVA